MKVAVLGGAGYVGSRLVPKLLAHGYEVVVYDTFWFGDAGLPKDNAHLRLVEGDIRDLQKLRATLRGVEAVIQLACISNDTCCQLDEKLSTSINYDAFEPMVVAAKEVGVRRFIYCSTSSVYGIAQALEVREDHPFLPLTLYNKYKGMCEPLLFKHQDADFVCTVLRPATVCGYAPRMRFDLTVNILTSHAVQKRLITVFGGDQIRSHLHIDDMCAAYMKFLDAPAALVGGEAFNVGVQNMSVAEAAVLVQGIVEEEMGYTVKIETKPSTDNRSYHINSDKLEKVLGFRAQLPVSLAIRQLCDRFKQGMWKDSLTNPRYTNIVQYQEKRAA